jgi:hypothetical protein
MGRGVWLRQPLPCMRIGCPICRPSVAHCCRNIGVKEAQQLPQAADRDVPRSQAMPMLHTAKAHDKGETCSVIQWQITQCLHRCPLP